MTLDERLTQMPTTMQVSRPTSTLVIGLGNPILGDDGVGWKIAQVVQERVEADPHFQVVFRPVDSKIVERRSSVEFDCLSLGGLSLMERMLGYMHVILIDSMETGLHPVGSIHVYGLDELPDPSAGHSASAHDTSLKTALQTASAIGAEIPARVDIVAVEAKNVYDFSEELSAQVARAVPLAEQAVLNLLKQ